MDQNKQGTKPGQQDDQANYNPTARNFDHEDVSGSKEPMSSDEMKQGSRPERQGDSEEEETNTSRS